MKFLFKAAWFVNTLFPPLPTFKKKCTFSALNAAAQFARIPDVETKCFPGHLHGGFHDGPSVLFLESIELYRVFQLKRLIIARINNWFENKTLFSFANSLFYSMSSYSFFLYYPSSLLKTVIEVNYLYFYIVAFRYYLLK